MLKLFCLLSAVLFSLNTHAIYLVSGEPAGQEVDLTTSKIRLVFSQDLIKLGEGPALKDEHRAKIITTNVDCNFNYEGTKVIACKPKAPLAPATHYKLEVENGLQGVDKQDSLTYRAAHIFKTDTLNIVGYEVRWDQGLPVIAVNFNMRVKDENRSGIIQCGDRNIEVAFEPLKDKKGEKNFRIKAKSALKEGESCVFYFDQPLSLKDHTLSVVPLQKILLEPRVANFQGNEGSFDYEARCRGSYTISARLFTSSMPYLKCEFNDSVDLGIYVDSHVKVEDHLEIVPKDKVKVTNNHGSILVSNFSSANRNYVIKVKKSLPLPNSWSSILRTEVKNSFKKDVYLQVETMDNPPLLAPVKLTGVIEKDGPWQAGYSALNIKSYHLYYDFKSSVDELRELTSLITTSDSYGNKRTFKITAADNQNQLLPINVKELAADKKFKAGLFTGRMLVDEVDPKFEAAETALIEDAAARKERREFKFGYLFTDIGIHVKKGKKGVLVWANGLTKGKPLEGVKLRLYQNGGRVMTATTNEEGLASFPDYLAEKDDEITVVATRGDDISFINSKQGAWFNGISRWDFNLGRYNWYAERNLLVDIVAERPLYLPNEKVNLKVYVRKKVPDTIELREASSVVKATIIDSRETEVKVVDLKLNDYGTAVMEYELPVKAPTGQYSVLIKDGEDSYHMESVFQVQEFKKPEFKVLMSEVGSDYQGEISYFKGGPVKDLPGELVVMFKKTTLKPQDEAFNRFSWPSGIGASYWDDEYYSSYVEIDVLSRNEIKSNEKGQFKTAKAPLLKTITKYGSLIVEGSFQDENGGNISGRIETKVNPYQYIPGIDLSRWMYKTGEKIEPEVVALGADEKPAVGVPMILKLIKVDWYYERRLGSGNYFYYDSRKIEKQIDTCNFTTAADFKACGIAVKNAGYYEFMVEVADKKLKAEPAKVGTYVYAAGEFLGFETANHDRMNLTVESTKLKLGGKLKVMAISPLQDGEALITLERDSVLYEKKVSFKGNVVLFEMDIEDEKFIPGFYVSIVVVKGRTSDKIENQIDLGRPSFKIGYKRVEVANAEKRLTVKVSPESKQLEPGTTQEATVEIKDYRGKAHQGELAIAVVDEALLSLVGAYQKNYDILDTFYTLGGLGVDNFQTLTQLIGRRTFGKKGANQGGGGGLVVRSDFKNTAYWDPQAETDKNGKYRFKFKVPDNLTTWKIIAVAVDKEHRFGVGNNEFIVSKALMIEPALPNFLVENDKFNAKVVVTNRSGETQDVKVEAKSSLFELEKKEDNILLAHDSKAPLFFPMTAKTAKTSELVFNARSKGGSDGFKIDLPVLPNVLDHAFVSTGTLKEKIDIPLAINPKARLESLSLMVKTSTTLIEGLDEVFRYVLDYPYGCWEQRLTGAYFLAQYRSMKDVLTYRFKETAKPVEAAIQDVLDQAADYQTADGGMRYYPGGMDESDPYLSIFTAHSFVTLKEMGHKVDTQVQDKLKAYLTRLLASDRDWSSWYSSGSRASNKAYILYILQEMGEKNLTSHISKLYINRAELDLFGLAYFSAFLSAQKSFEKEAKVVAEKLDGLKTTSGGRTHYREPMKVLEQWKYFNYTDNRSQCAVLQTLVKRNQDFSTISPVVNDIMKAMTAKGHWYNTQENKFCFEGIRLFSNKFEKQGRSPEVAIKLDGKKVDVKAQNRRFTSTVDLTSKEMKTGESTLGLESSQKEEIYYTSVLRYQTPYEKREATSHGFKLQKTLKLLSLKDGKATWSELKGGVANLKRGDIVKITLNVESKVPHFHVMLNDTLAGGLTPVNTQLATTSLASGNILQREKKTCKWETAYYCGSFEYMDLRLTAAQFYSRHLGVGKFEVEYLVQAIATGEFNMPESTIEEMYYPEVRATETGRKINISE